MFFFQIFSLVENVIQVDKSIEVKRAAVLLVTLLLQGLGPDALKVSEVIKQTYLARQVTA